jgi:hypothetical protein
MNVPSVASVAVLLVMTCAIPRAARADDASVARGKALFEDGKRLLESKDYDKACPLLAESFELTAATGPLLALAVCHEGQGKTASAWSEYNAVVARTRAQGQADWADRAERAAMALEPNLPRLRVVLQTGAESIPGLVLTRDGQPLGAAAVGASVPVDPGVHLVEASAPGRRPWSGQALATEGVTLSISVPPPESELPPTMPATRPEHEGSPQASRLLRTIGIATGAVGLVGLGIGSYLGGRAMVLNSDSEPNCPRDVCNAAGRQERLDAISAANTATIPFVAGGILLAGGVTLFVLGRPGSGPPSLMATAIAGAGTAGVVVHGGF